LSRPGCERSTMMGFPCLRRDGQFFACLHRTGESVIVKVSKDRVLALVAEDRGEHFAPNGRTFREWVAIPTELSATWAERLEEAWFFAGGE
ncbi:MAG: hypothetical protein KC561_11225, partial [Myxococcales bacterium]|nr:hypothetical protein [Myxococcales bacterium]